MTCSTSNPHHLSRSAAWAPGPEPTCVSRVLGVCWPPWQA